MLLPELKPLLDKVECLQNHADAHDVYADIASRIEKASTPTMGQSVCEHIISMCSPKAWGDRFVSDWGYEKWDVFLSQLSDIAENCGQAIYEKFASDKTRHG